MTVDNTYSFWRVLYVSLYGRRMICWLCGVLCTVRRWVLKDYNIVIKRKYRAVKRVGRVTFWEFVQYLIDPQTPRPFNIHWQPFHETCYPCYIHYDFIGHYETLAEDSSYVINKLGFKSIRFPSKNVFFQSHRHVAKMFANLNESEIQRLFEIYRLDFALFGYSDNMSQFILWRSFVAYLSPQCLVWTV